MNKLILIGNVGKEPEVKYTATGTALASLSLAVNERYKNKNGEAVNETEWFRLVAYQRTAEIIGEYVKKGSKIAVTGRQKTRKYQDRDGNEKSITEVIVSELEILSTRQENGDDNSIKQTTKKQQAQNNEEFEDDIPF